MKYNYNQNWMEQISTDKTYRGLVRRKIKNIVHKATPQNKKKN